MNASIPSPSRPGFFWLVLFGVAYLGGCWLGYWLTLMPFAGVTLWPPSGLYLAALLLSEKHHWPWWIMAGLPAEVAGSMALFGFPFSASLVIYLGNSLEALAGAWLIRHWCGVPFRLDGLQEVLVLTLCGAVIGPALSATLGAATLAVTGKTAFITAWPLWWVGDAVGALIVTPVILTAVYMGKDLRQVKSERWVEWLAVLAVFIGFGHLVFSGAFPFTYLITPPLLWATLRFGVPGATAITLILTIMVARYTAADLGAFANPAFGPEERQWLTELFLGITTVSSLVVASLTTQHRRALLTLRQAHDELDVRVTERTAALRKSEERLRLALEAAYLVSFEWEIQRDEVRRSVSSDPALPPTPEGSHSTFAEVCRAVHPEDRERFIAQVQAAQARADGHYEGEFRLIRPDGSIAWISERGRVEFDLTGRPERLVGLSQDITGRKQAELALQAQSELLAAIVNNIPVMLCIWEPGLKQFRFNQHLHEVLGWAEADVTEGDLLTKCYPDPAYRQWVADYMLSLEDGWRDMRSTAKDGSLVDTAWANIRLPDGTTIGIGLDIRQRKADEMAVRDSEGRYRSLFEASRDGIVTVAPDGPILDANPAYQAMLGYTLDELNALTYQQLTPARWHAIEDAIVRDKILARGDSGEYEKEYIRKDGSVFPISIRTWPLRDGAGHLTGLQGIVRDITERKQAEEDLRRMAEALREADRRKDEFLATLAHELRNPLAPIRNALHLLRRTHGPEPANEERLLAMMQRQLDHLVRLVDDLLEVSRISQGKIVLRKEFIDLSTILSHALETSRPLIEAAGHRLSVDLPPEPILLDADPVRLAQVFANLLNNAAKYTESRGHIRLIAQRRGGEAVVSVIDSGVGIPAEMLPHVFDLFAQVDRSLGRAQGGLGIGLALVRNLVEMHGGRVEVHSDGMGRGSEFSAYLPLAEDRPMQPIMPDKPPRQLGPLCRMLVVDDNQDAADSLGLLLEALEYEVRVVYDGATALSILGEFKPAVVLLDIGMPDMDGYETARRIRQRPEGRDVSLIALTGWGQEDDRRRTQEAGFDQHLVKPVEIEVLQGLLVGVK